MIYMLPLLRIAGQTTGLIGLTFFLDTHGRPVLKATKINSNIFSDIFSHEQHRALQLVIIQGVPKKHGNSVTNSISS